MTCLARRRVRRNGVQSGKLRDGVAARTGRRGQNPFRTMRRMARFTTSRKVTVGGGSLVAVAARARRVTAERSAVPVVAVRACCMTLRGGLRFGAMATRTRRGRGRGVGLTVASGTDRVPCARLHLPSRLCMASRTESYARLHVRRSCVRARARKRERVRRMTSLAFDRLGVKRSVVLCRHVARRTCLRDGRDGGRGVRCMAVDAGCLGRVLGRHVRVASCTRRFGRQIGAVRIVTAHALRVNGDAS